MAIFVVERYSDLLLVASRCSCTVLVGWIWESVLAVRINTAGLHVLFWIRSTNFLAWVTIASYGMQFMRSNCDFVWIVGVPDCTARSTTEVSCCGKSILGMGPSSHPDLREKINRLVWILRDHKSVFVRPCSSLSGFSLLERSSLGVFMFFWLLFVCDSDACRPGRSGVRGT